MSQVILLNKPFRVLSQFTDREQPDKPRATLSDFLSAPGFRPAGRLDYDSEGLLVLTQDGKTQQRIAHPIMSSGRPTGFKSKATLMRMPANNSLQVLN